jgi:hypothetical protein
MDHYELKALLKQQLPEGIFISFLPESMRLKFPSERKPSPTGVIAERIVGTQNLLK